MLRFVFENFLKKIVQGLKLQWDMKWIHSQTTVQLKCVQELAFQQSVF